MKVLPREHLYDRRVAAVQVPGVWNTLFARLRP
jgi:hypothetical protein